MPSYCAYSLKAGFSLLEHWAYFSPCSKILLLCWAEHPWQMTIWSSYSTPKLSTMLIHSWCALNACQVHAWKCLVYAFHMLGTGYMPTSFLIWFWRKKFKFSVLNFYRWRCIWGWGHLCSGPQSTLESWLLISWSLTLQPWGGFNLCWEMIVTWVWGLFSCQV